MHGRISEAVQVDLLLYESALVRSIELFSNIQPNNLHNLKR